jgi:OmpA-OmpF porin, OOP family
MIEIGRKIAIAGVAMLALAASAACGSGSGSGGTSASPSSCLALKVPVALAIGARSNSPTQVLNTTVTTVLNSAIDAYQTITLVRLDGKPKTIFSQAFTPGANSQITKLNRNKYAANLNQILQGTPQPTTDIRAQAPQADILDALAEAASTVPAGGDVVVMDSGLQTVEPLDFRTGLLNDDPSSIVDYLRHAGELPDLKGRHIYFTGLGWTAAPQPTLSISDRQKVVQIWEQIAQAAGAGCVAIDQTANTSTAVPDRPPVAIVTPPPPPPPPTSCSVINL